MSKKQPKKELRGHDMKVTCPHCRTVDVQKNVFVASGIHFREPFRQDKDAGTVISTSELEPNGILKCEECDKEFAYKLQARVMCLTAPVGDYEES